MLWKGAPGALARKSNREMADLGQNRILTAVSERRFSARKLPLGLLAICELSDPKGQGGSFLKTSPKAGSGSVPLVITRSSSGAFWHC